MELVDYVALAQYTMLNFHPIFIPFAQGKKTRLAGFIASHSYTFWSEIHAQGSSYSFIPRSIINHPLFCKMQHSSTALYQGSSDSLRGKNLRGIFPLSKLIPEFAKGLFKVSVCWTEHSRLLKAKVTADKQL